MELMHVIDEQYTKTHFYGSRRMREALKRKGYFVNRKRIQRLMRLMGIEAIYSKKNFSKPSPGCKIYSYFLFDIFIYRLYDSFLHFFRFRIWLNALATLSGISMVILCDITVHLPRQRITHFMQLSCRFFCVKSSNMRCIYRVMQEVIC